MAVEYRLDIRDTAGALQYVVTGDVGGGGFAELSYQKRVNAPGLLTVVFEGTSPVLTTLAHMWCIEVWRRDIENSIAWYRDFAGFVLRRTWSYTDHERVTVTCPGVMWLLSTRHVLWYAGTANRSKYTSVAAETIMKSMVTYNATSSGTVVAGRLRLATVTPTLNVEADGANGNSLDWYCAWDNLLESLQSLALVAGGDFDVLPDSTAGQFIFNWYTTQRGTDRTATVIFALEHGNMAEPVYDSDRIEEKTVAIALGQGEGTNRASAIRTGTDYHVSTNNVEFVVNGSNEATAAALNALGDKHLKDRQQQQTFTFKAVQTASTRYGSNVFFGDKVTARYSTVVEVARKIMGVNVAYKAGGEEAIGYEFGLP